MMACKYAVEQNIIGDFVECGVWRGGNALLAAAIFKSYGSNKKVYLFDTFEGMTKPQLIDESAANGKSALNEFNKRQKRDYNDWCYASIDDVKDSFRRFNLLNENVTFVKGDVLKTLDDERSLPIDISVLRLDTDWYESTLHELKCLYPKLQKSGILIIDDYGCWRGCQKAVDEYFGAAQPFFYAIDTEAVVATKSF